MSEKASESDVSGVYNRDDDYQRERNDSIMNIALAGSDFVPRLTVRQTRQTPENQNLDTMGFTNLEDEELDEAKSLGRDQQSYSRKCCGNFCTLGPKASSCTPKYVNGYKVVTIVLHVILNLFLMGGFTNEIHWTALIFINAGMGAVAYILILRVMCSDAGIQPTKLRLPISMGGLGVIDEEVLSQNSAENSLLNEEFLQQNPFEKQLIENKDGSVYGRNLHFEVFE
jgi:hypothetical protein